MQTGMCGSFKMRRIAWGKIATSPVTPWSEAKAGTPSRNCKETQLWSKKSLMLRKCMNQVLHLNWNLLKLNLVSRSNDAFKDILTSDLPWCQLAIVFQISCIFFPSPQRELQRWLKHQWNHECSHRFTEWCDFYRKAHCCTTHATTPWCHRGSWRCWRHHKQIIHRKLCRPSETSCCLHLMSHTVMMRRPFTECHIVWAAVSTFSLVAHESSHSDGCSEGKSDPVDRHHGAQGKKLNIVN